MDFFGFDLKELLISIGIFGAWAILFAESGLFFGFFLPGDSLIFTAGLLASQDYFNVWGFVLGGIIAAITGVEVGYYFGKKFGPKIFNKEESVFFHKDPIRRAQEFYAKHGAITLILARFVPIVRTFAPILAGAGQMDQRKFFFYNVTGAILWIGSLTAVGYFAGELIPDIDRYILPIVALIIFLSILPGIFNLLKQKRAKVRPPEVADQH